MQFAAFSCASVIHGVNINKELSLPALVCWALSNEPLLEATVFDVALDFEDFVHLLVLNDHRVCFSVACWERFGRHNFPGLLIEVVMLMLCKLFPPLFAPWKRKPLKKVRLTPGKVGIRVYLEPSFAIHLLGQE